jgi:hypothetical protein
MDYTTTLEKPLHLEKALYGYHGKTAITIH